MQIHGPSHIHGPHGINPPHHPRLVTPARLDSADRTADRLEISPAAEAALEATAGTDIRYDLVTRIRAEIAAGIYETPEKLESAVDRLFDDLA
jgi:negative regulator of flagellin synthesis FlgM